MQIYSAYPATNSAYSVSEHSLAIMKSEFARGHEIVQSSPIDWDKLFEPSDFFLKYECYIRCNIIGSDNDSRSVSWTGFVESRIRHITKYLMRGPFKQLHLYPARSVVQTSGSVCYFVGLKIDKVRLKGQDIHMASFINDFK
jgi:poly(A) polymerase